MVTKERCKKHASEHDDVCRVVDFVKSYADVHAVPLPGRLPKHQDYRVMKLPSDVTKEPEYADVTCPMPISSRPEATIDPVIPPTKRIRLCSHCKQPGHTKTVGRRDNY